MYNSCDKINLVWNGGMEAMEEEREIRLLMQEIEALLKNTKLIALEEAVYEVRIEPGELVIKLVR